MEPSHRSSSPRADTSPPDRLDSWKEIARYLKRDESTVQRWERREGMPVHRHVHAERGSVYAFPAELDQWWQSRRKDVQAKGAAAGGRRRVPRMAVAAVIVIGGAALMAQRWPLPSPAVGPPDSSLTRITSTTGLNIDPAFSADGSLVAYASDRDDSAGLDIWVQPRRSEEPTRVTREPGDEVEPSFSPDGASIVFVKPEAGGIHIIGAFGGESRLLAAAARARTPRFSPDGRSVLFWSGLPAWNAAGAPGASGALYVVPSVGGSPRPVAQEFATARYGIWSPDGGKMLFLGERTADSAAPSLDWYVVPAQGGAPVRTGALEAIRRAGATGLPIPGAWSADGDLVVFATFEETASNVWQVAISPSTGRVISRPQRLTFGPAVGRSPVVSAAGQVAFTSVTANVDVWRVPLDEKTGVASGPLERVTDNAAVDAVTNVSADGHTMVFMSSRTGQREVWTRDLRTGRESRITHAGAKAGRLSPDGSTIAVARDTSETDDVYLSPANGGTVRALCEDCRIADWSPDGRRMLLLRGVPSRVVIRDLDSGREKELAAHPEWSLLQGRFSPDGRWVVFHTTNAPSVRQVFVVPTFLDGPVPEDAWIPVVTDFGIQPNWSATGDGIYHFSLRDGAFCAWLQPLDAVTRRPVGEPRAVQHLHHPRLNAVRGAMVTNDVRAGFLYVTLTEEAGNIWVLDR
jgi:Tol biopolymer transport system component